MLALALLPDLLVTLGPSTVVYDRGESYYFNPDAAFPVFRSRDGKGLVALWGPGRPTRYAGPSLDRMVQSGPCPAPVRRSPGIGRDWDSSGSWMLAADRAADGTLVSLVHAEDHTFADGGRGEWNSSGVWISADDGRSWTNLGEVVGAAKPEKARHGGLDLRAMVWHRERKAWLAYCGAIPFESKDPHAAPGTWFGYRDGAFSERIDPTQPPPSLSSAPGLPKDVTWGSLSWNVDLKAYLYVWREPGGAPRNVLMARSRDGLHWNAPTRLRVVGAGQAFDYPTLVGASSAVTGRDCRLVFAQAPGTGLARKDMIERWVHFGPLGVPRTPSGVSASGALGYEEAVRVAWNAAPMAQAYEVWRREGKAWNLAGMVESSSAEPSYVDRMRRVGEKATYRVVARNAAGASSPTAAVVGSAIAKRFRIQNVASGLVLEAGADGHVDQRPLARGRASQDWRFVSAEGRAYGIVNVANGFVLGTEDASPRPGVLVVTVPQTSPVPRWRVELAGPTLAILEGSSGLGLDGEGGGTAPGTRIDLFAFRGAAHQRWRILGSVSAGR